MGETLLDPGKISAPMGVASRRKLLLELAAVAVAVVGLGHGAFGLPPDGDAAMGLFPAAIWLADHGFDLPGLLSQPGFWDGGPNNYAISPVTWLLAVVLVITGGGGWTLPLLHAAQLVVSIVALVGFRRLAAPALGEPASWLACGAVLLLPLFLVQTQTIYFEMPLFLCAVGAARSWLTGKPLRAGAWAFAAAMIKPSGVILSGALAALAVVERRTMRTKLGGAALLLVPALVPVFVEMIVKQAPGQALFPDNPGFRAYLVDHLWRLVRFVPDAAAITGAAVLVAVARLPGWLRSVRTPSVQRVCDALVLVYAGFFLLAPPLTGYLVYVLPRYFAFVLPFALIGLGAAVRRRLGDRTLLAVLAALGLFFALNQAGRWYPSAVDNEYSVAERSSESRDVVALRRDVLRFAVDRARGRPLVVSLFDWFHLRHPVLGYVDEPAPGVVCHAFDPGLRAGGIDAWPEEFVLVRTFDGNRTAAVNALLQQLWRRSPDAMRTREFRRGRFRMAVIEVRSSGR